MRVLAIIHQPNAGPGVFAEAIAASGATLDAWQLGRADPPPRDPRSYDAVLTFGGGMNADQEDVHPWLGREKRLLAELLELEVPLLGVCLGAQLLAEAGGVPARRGSAPEIGWYPVQTTGQALGDPLFGPLAPGFRALEWHSYEFPLPDGAVALARSEACLQAYRLGGASWGIQFHAEVTLADFESWVSRYGSDPDAVALRVDPEQLRAQTRAAITGWNQLGRELCTRFLSVAESARR